MVALIFFLAVIYPWTVLSFYFLGRLVLPGQVVTTIICALGLALLVLGRYQIYGKRDRWIVPFILFLVVGSLAIALSPYREEIVGKGVIQVIGIGVALVSCMVMIREIEKRPHLMIKLVRLLSISLGILGWIGIFQFIAFNTIGLGSLFDFSFLNSVFGYTAWRYPGEIGGVYRANSLAQEPAHLARYLLSVCGFALLRVGMVGRKFQDSIKPAIPFWTAVGVLGGVLTTLSLLAYIGLVVVAGACWLLSQKIKGRLFLGAAASIAVTVGIIGGLVSYTGEEFIDKAASVALIARVGVEQGTLSTGIGAGELSALAVAGNMAVMADNLPRHPLIGVGLGGHPASYERYAPPYARYSEELEDLNAQDAASLLVRLLSETGIVGTVLFLIGGFGLLASCRRAIIGALNKARSAVNAGISVQPFHNQIIVATVGIAAGWAGVFCLYLLRAGQYYEQAMWVPIALAAVAPYLIRKTGWPARSS